MTFAQSALENICTNANGYLSDSAGENSERERERANRGKQEVNKTRRGSRNAQSHHKSNNFSPLLYVHQQRIGLHAHSLLSSIKFSQLVPCVVKSGRWDGKTCLSDTNWSSFLFAVYISTKHWERCVARRTHTEWDDYPIKKQLCPPLSLDLSRYFANRLWERQTRENFLGRDIGLW